MGLQGYAKEPLVSAAIRFHGELVGLMGPAARAKGLAYPVDRRASIKDVIEALGVPHSEVYVIEANGKVVDFGYLLEGGAQVDVRPARPPVDVTKPTLLRPDPLPATRFVADVNVGRLANLLRILGLDTAFGNGWDDEAIANIAVSEGRIVLSRDRDLLKRAKVVYGRLVRAEQPEEQLQEVLKLFGIQGPFAYFSRCLRCNTPLTPVDKQAILDRLLPKTKKFYDAFSTCPSCGRIYWAGSHYERVSERLRGLGLGPEEARAGEERS